MYNITNKAYNQCYITNDSIITQEKLAIKNNTTMVTFIIILVVMNNRKTNLSMYTKTLTLNLILLDVLHFILFFKSLQNLFKSTFP